MEEQLVSFETAKLAKEKGFKSKSKYYDGSGKLVKTPDISGNDYSHTNNMMQRFRYEAPKQSLLQKWLRENGKNRVLVEVDDWDNFIVRVYAEDCMSPFFEVFTSNEYRTYEEALEIGLQEALKLLP